MQYVKKFLVLKQTQPQDNQIKPLTALARIEIENDKALFNFSLVNLVRSNNCCYYALVVDQDKNTFEFNLGNNPSTFLNNFTQIPKVESSLAIGFYCVKDFIPLTLAFCSQGDKAITLNDFKKLVAQEYLVKHEQFNKNNQSLEQDNDCQTQQFEELQTVYNDEAVATQNYYQLDQEIKQKLLCIKEQVNENIWLKDELPDSDGKPQAQEECQSHTSIQDETNATMREEDLNSTPYFFKVKHQLDEIFIKYPQEESLTKLFYNSKWAKIHYSPKKYYVVGVIDLDNEQKFICYGIPAPYSNEPPQALKGFSSFVPKSIFDMQGEGFWIMFQDAITGDCVHLG